MATELALERNDKAAIGSFKEIQDMIQAVFPGAQFGWTTSGTEKLRMAAERGVELPPALREAMKTLPSLLEGRYESGDDYVEFGLGYQEPVKCLYVTPRGGSPTLDRQLSELETRVGGTFVVSGEETNQLTNPGTP